MRLRLRRTEIHNAEAPPEESAAPAACPPGFVNAVAAMETIANETEGGAAWQKR